MKNCGQDENEELGLECDPPHARGVFCNRTLNMRSIRAIGYDMDYTLVHYDVYAWEMRAFEHLKLRFLENGWPVENCVFDPQQVARGLIVDTKLGNIVKANRFGYVKLAYHGTRRLDFDEQRRVYSRVVVDLAQERWVFLNTLFSLSEASMYSQLVVLLDNRQLPDVLGYANLFHCIHRVLDQAHMEGELKAEIMADPERFVSLDAETARALLDQKQADKKLMLITNSGWSYTNSMMSYAFERFLPGGMKWRDLFEVVVVEARKPEFFLSHGPLFEVVNDQGLLKPAMAITKGGIFFGGDASLVEKRLGVSGDEILYVGDHMWGDVHVSKSALRWRTALILRELESEIQAMESFSVSRAQLKKKMREKEKLEHQICRLRLALQRWQAGELPGDNAVALLEKNLERTREELESLDSQIAPLAQASGELGNPYWGLLLRSGNDKSHLASQVERYADVYTSRVSNLLYRTPFVFYRSAYGVMPHDQD